ncbi:MAG: response regulator [Deltaproteobacteria bacterium]|nr:response regulator [Deltaproteobacteria bacterium]
MRILYVEDNAPNFQLVQRILGHDGHEVIHAQDGAAALVAARKERPDLVLMDLGLPGMDGYETARRLRELPELAGLPIAALTASVRDADRDKAKAEGFAGFIEKPFRMDMLRREVQRLLPK